MRGTLCVPQDAVFCAEGATEEEESQVTGSAEAGDGKADFEHIYNRPDPRDYFRTLGKLDYEIPQRAQPVFQALLTALRSRREGAGATAGPSAAPGRPAARAVGSRSRACPACGSSPAGRGGCRCA